MPSAQVIDFGADPYQNAMGGFAKNFLSTINEKSAQRRNEELFKRIADNYGEDSNPEDLFRDVLKSEGMDQEYKRNKLNEIKEYSQLATKAKLTGVDAAKLEQRKDELKVRQKTNEISEARIKNEEARIKTASEKAKRDLPKEIAAYTKNLFKDQDLDPEDTADINYFIREQMEDAENPIGIDQAAKKAYEFNRLQKQIINESKFVEKPSSYIPGYNPKSEKEFQQAEQELQRLHDEDGITSQKDLRKIAKRGGWSNEEITQMLQNVFRRNGKALRGPKPKESSPEASAQIPFEKQGQVSQEAGIDDFFRSVSYTHLTLPTSP
jgi:hypothetical protein